MHRTALATLATALASASAVAINVRREPVPAHPTPNNDELHDRVVADLFLLLRTQEVCGEVFTCPATRPSSHAEKDNFGGGTNTALNRSNFTDIAKNLSYSYANPYPSTTALGDFYKLNNNLSPDFAVIDLEPISPTSPSTPPTAATPASATTPQSSSPPAPSTAPSPDP